MKERLNIDTIINTIDFENVSQKLDFLAESWQSQRRKTANDLLDKMRPALLKARENKVPFGAPAKLLKENGIAVSETILRKYLNTLPGVKKTHKPRRKSVLKSELPNDEEAAKKELPPRLASRLIGNLT